jgi:hypothetical protein
VNPLDILFSLSVCLVCIFLLATLLKGALSYLMDKLYKEFIYKKPKILAPLLSIVAGTLVDEKTVALS